MAVQMTIIPSSGDVFVFDTTDNVPLDDIVPSGGGPRWVVRERPNGPPTVWHQGRTLKRMTVRGRLDILELGRDPLAPLDTFWREATVVTLSRPTRPPDGTKWVIESFDVEPTDQWASEPQTVGYTIVFQEYPE